MADPTTTQCALKETWDINNRVNLRLLDALTDEQLAAVILPRGKAVTSYFVHIHMARFYWLERRAPALAKRLKKIPGGTAPRATLRQALIDSGEAMGELFAEAERTGQIKGVKLGPVGFLGYALAHEGHHRGQILLHLKIAKLPLDRDIGYSLWYWNKI
ncbi:MAG: DinB family protein [Terriglobia bacterium]